MGAYDFGGKLVDSMTAHPKICPTTGELHFFGYGNIFEPYVTYHRADANGELTINRPLDVPALTMMHDFALTAEHVIFMDLPIVFNLDIAMKGEPDMPYRWDDNYGARLGVLRRDDPFGRSALVRDRSVLRVPRRQRLRQRQLDCAAGGPLPGTVARHSGFETDGVLWSWTIDLQTGKVAERQLDDRAVEFPRIDDRLAGLPARYAVSVGVNELVRYDLSTGSAVEHRFGTAESPGRPGEAVFVPSTTGPADEGTTAGTSATSTTRPATAATW